MSCLMNILSLQLGMADVIDIISEYLTTRRLESICWYKSIAALKTQIIPTQRVELTRSKKLSLVFLFLYQGHFILFCFDMELSKMQYSPHEPFFSDKSSKLKEYQLCTAFTVPLSCWTSINNIFLHYLLKLWIHWVCK